MVAAAPDMTRLLDRMEKSSWITQERLVWPGVLLGLLAGAFLRFYMPIFARPR
jgi:hypothetical protein